MMDDSLYRINLGSMSVKKVVEACLQALTAHRRVTDTLHGWILQISTHQIP